MNRKNYKKHIAYELLVVLGMSAILLFICRLWPLLILALLGMLGAAAWLILANRNAEELEKPCALLPSHEQNEALGRIQAQISGMVREEHPNARWIWKTPNAKALVCSGEDASILLNRAGGYREAVVHMNDGKVESLEYLLPPEPQEGETSEEPEFEDGEPVNYELVAFEWVDANVMALNERCNEGIAQGLNDILLEPAELPNRESWPEICRELERNDMDGCQCEDGGIRISLTGKRSGR